LTFKSHSTRDRLLSCFLLFVASCLVSCDRKAQVEIENGTPPKFRVSGRGTLNSFDILGPDLEREQINRQGDSRNSLPKLKLYWKIVPNENGTNKTIDEIGVIVYGQVPNGFTQAYPEHGAPPPLIERDLYNVALVPKEIDSTTKFFSIRDGKILAEGEN
jgi:hypothetical protein